MILRLIFTNPHFRAAAVLSKLLTNIGTMAWAVVVLWTPDVVHVTAYGWIVDYVNVIMFASIMLLCSLAQIVWLVMHWPPNRYGGIGYGLLMTWWMFVFYSVLVGRPLAPTALAGVSVLVICSVFACLSWPRRDAPAN